MNRQFDVIVVGDSKAGNAALKSIAAANRSIKVAFISRDFKSTTTRDFLNVEYIKEEVVFTDYKNRLFCCYLKNGERQYCTHLIIASGLKYAPFMVGNKPVTGVFNTINEIPKSTKQQVAVVIGTTDAEVKLALAVAKKYKYVYICTKSMQLDITEATKKKLDAAKNILLMNNASLTKAIFTDNQLTSVNLDNYAKITCNAIFAITLSTPEVDFVSEKLINRDAEGYLNISNASQSLLVPKCFAVGNCVKKSTKKMQAAMVDTVLKDFNGG
jgi:thioredoxin reductase